MRSMRLKISYRRKAVAAAAGGVLLALAFPRFELFYLVFVALVPLFFILRNEKGVRAFGLGFVFGLLFYLISLFWITEALSNYSALGFWSSVLILLLLVAYLSALVGVFANVVSLCRQDGRSVVLVPMFWVAIEFTKAKVLSGFPWNDLSWALYRQTTLIQIADALGSYGVSFGIVLVNWLVFLLLARLVKRRVELGWGRILATLALVFIFAWGYGSIRLSTFPPSSASIKVGIIQPNIPQAMKLSGRFMQQMLETYAQQAGELQAKGATKKRRGKPQSEDESENAKPGAKRLLVKQIGQKGLVVDCGKLQWREAERWVRAEAQQLGKKVTPRASAALLEAVGADLGQLENELRKLVDYAADSPVIAERAVEELVSQGRTRSIFGIGDAVAGGDAAHAFRLCQHLLLRGEELTDIISILARRTRQLWQIKRLNERGATQKEIAAQVKVPAFVVTNSLKILSEIPEEALARHLSVLADADHELKTTAIAPREEEVWLMRLLAKLCRSASSDATRP